MSEAAKAPPIAEALAVVLPEVAVAEKSIEVEVISQADLNDDLRSANVGDDYQEVDIEDQSKRHYSQWQKVPGGFAPSSDTLKALPPGLYTIAFSPQMGLYLTPVKVNTDKLLNLPDSKSAQVLKEINAFWEKKDAFKKLGFTYKRGFLLWGPPGGGKTSTVMMTVQSVIKNGGIAIIADAKPDMVSGMLKMFRNAEPNRSMVVLMEDIDAAIGNWGEDAYLAILDGDKSIDNVVFIATTNYPEKLDGRVINRPSRFDRVIRVGMPQEEARKTYLLSRGIKFTDKELDRWVKLTAGFSIAHIKEMIISVYGFGETLEAVVKRMKAMAVKVKSTDESDDPKWSDSLEEEEKEEDEDEDD